LRIDYTHWFSSEEHTLSSKTAAPLSPSRPADKAAQILRAAREEFLRHGYAATSMDAVALTAQVSKATLYVYYGSKRDLFAAIIQQERDRYAGSMLSGESGREPIEAKLLRFGRNIVDFLVSADTIASYRMVMGEAGRLPELGEAFFMNGPVKLLDRLEEYIDKAMRSGSLRRDDARCAAEQLIGLVRGDLQLRALLGVTDGLTRARMDAVIRAGVETFYRAYRPAGI
jgi:TetR/AcrR family transcriptional regulator, mexJK operon transcriptional repressor